MLKRNSVLYLAVSPDSFELPFAVANNLNELSKMTGIKNRNISTAIARKLSGKVSGFKFLRIEVGND